MSWLIDLEQGLHEVRAASEIVWANARNYAFDPHASSSRYRFVRGTRWRQTLDDRAVDELAVRLGFAIPDDYRMYLKTLNGTTPEMRGAGFGPMGLVASSKPGFYSWETDADAIAAASHNVIDGLLFDVEHSGLWLASWGIKPKQPDARLAELIAGAPPLIPLFGHRYLLVTSDHSPNVVLSIRQSDIIVYGVNILDYLASELHIDIGDQRAALAAASAKEFEAIPFWGELIG